MIREQFLRRTTALNMTESELARRANIQQSTVHRILSGESKDPKFSHVASIAKCLNVSLDDDKPRIDMVCEPRDSYGLTPEQSKTPIYELKSLEDPSPVLISKLTCPVESGPNTYGVIVPDDTMESPHFRHSYPKGSVIFIDPDQANQAKDEDFVIAKWDDGRLTFKRLIENQEGRWLRSINPMYPPVPPSHNGQFQVTGLVIGCWHSAS